jgi:hypothetical protein
MTRSTIHIGGTEFLLAQGQDLAELRRHIEEALHGGGAFVEFVVMGNRTVSVLITGSDLVFLTEQSVPFDARDTGDVEMPFGGIYDVI